MKFIFVHKINLNEQTTTIVNAEHILFIDSVGDGSEIALTDGGTILVTNSIDDILVQIDGKQSQETYQFDGQMEIAKIKAKLGKIL